MLGEAEKTEGEKVASAGPSEMILLWLSKK